MAIKSVKNPPSGSMTVPVLPSGKLILPSIPFQQFYSGTR